MDRLVILLEHPENFVGAWLTHAALEAASRRQDLALTGVVIRRPMHPFRLWRRHWVRACKRHWHQSRAPVGDGTEPPEPMGLLDLGRLRRQYGFAVLSPPAGNLNDSGFIASLQARCQPTLGLTFLCGQRYSPVLLQALGRAANYHNGALPAYRGLFATNWSLYHQEPATGFTYHWMAPELDTGPVLMAGTIPITPASNLWQLEQDKTRQAAAVLPAVLDRMAQRDPGVPQQGQAGYFSAADHHRIRTVADPAGLTGTELLRRLRAFGVLHMARHGRWAKVWGLEEVSSQGEFQTADGRQFRVRGAKWLKGPPAP